MSRRRQAQDLRDAAPEFEYAVEVLPPGRVGFRRWRWELWRGGWLLASGWRTTPRDAERALFTAASRSAHDRLGVRALRPESARALGRFVAGAAVAVDCGSFTCRLVPRGADALAA